jgi:predicted O-methyltransferase YrrM
MQKINLNIPGWNGPEILEIIGNYSSNVPSNGNILELGALFGRTTAVIGNCKPAEAHLYTIDIWPVVSGEHIIEILKHDGKIGNVEKELLMRLVDKTVNKLSGDDFHLAWKIFTSHINNLHGIRSLTNISTTEFPSFDLIIHDAAHDYEHVYEDLTNWFPKLKPGCVMLIDDYEPNWPGVIQAVDQYVLENNLTTEMVTNRNILLKRN